MRRNGSVRRFETLETARDIRSDDLAMIVDAEALGCPDAVRVVKLVIFALLARRAMSSLGVRPFVNNVAIVYRCPRLEDRRRFLTWFVFDRFLESLTLEQLKTYARDRRWPEPLPEPT
jgi:hypothetical protein